MTWNPVTSGGGIDPHQTPYTSGPIEPAPQPYNGVFPHSDVSSAPAPDPHDCPVQLSDGLGGGMATSPIPTNIRGGPLSDGRKVNEV